METSVRRTFLRLLGGYFNIFECGGNILDRIDVMYERACMAISKDKYYTTLLETLVDDNNRNGALLSNEKLQQAFGRVMEETEAEFECHNKITMDTSYQSHIQKKDISTINDSIYFELDDQVDTIFDSKEQVDPNSDPRIDTHINDRIQKLSIRPITLKPVLIGQDLVTSARKTSRDGFSLNIFNPLHTISVKEIVTEMECNSSQVDRISVRTPIKTIHNQPGVNVYCFSPRRGSNSSFTKWSRNIKPLNTFVDGSAAQESNSNCTCIEKVGMKNSPQ